MTHLTLFFIVRLSILSFVIFYVLRERRWQERLRITVWLLIFELLICENIILKLIHSI